VRRSGFALLLVLAAAAPAAAEDDIDCSNAVAQAEMNICAEQDFEAADAELNTVWKNARKAAKEMDSDLSDDLKGADKALLAAQRAWIGYRDAECELDGFQARGGTMEPQLMSSCKAGMTRVRTKELKEFIGGDNQ
jgi:uncharacterized protein YecT (DUF1311 family)